MTKRITQLTALTTPKNAMELIVYDQDDTYDKKITYANIMAGIVVEGAGIPVSAPSFKGQIYIDTTNGWRYIATGTSVVSDWHLQYAYGTLTITAGGGDVTVNLGGNWIGGKLEVYITETASDYFHTNATGKRCGFITTHDALTNTSATFTAKQIMSLLTQTTVTTSDQKNIQTLDDTSAIPGLPNAANDTSFTLDDDGITTIYVKWVINA